MNRTKLTLISTWLTPETLIEPTQKHIANGLTHESGPWHVATDIDCSSRKSPMRVQDLMDEFDTDVSFYRENIGVLITQGLVKIGGSNET